jgi:ATP-binding cassette, subfamily F, member 3
MIRAQHLYLRRGAKLLIEDANFSLFPGQKVGVVGRNGCGKSSLFSILLGGHQVDQGALEWPTSWRIASVAQHTPDSELPAIDFAMQGDSELTAIEAKLDTLPPESPQAMSLYMEFDHLDGYTWRARAAKLLDGLGFDSEAQLRPVNHYSGGWRMRLALAQTLIRRSDLLLLDEPTNHLDLDSLLWLQDWLRRYEGTVLTISHDREFLDAVCSHILHLDGHTANLYQGNYSSYASQAAAHAAQAQAQAASIAARRAHLQKFVDRFKAQASKAKQAQSRVKMLERLGAAPAPREEGDVEISLPKPARMPEPLLAIKYASVGYGEQAILHKVNLSLAPGDRIGLLGRNGAGKSTLVKLIAGVLPIMDGERTPARDLEVGYFSQHQVEEMDETQSPIELLRNQEKGLGEQAARNYLGGYYISGDMATQAIAPRSGGEKARIALALILFSKPNLLLLDEPTNHLDLQMREALAEALNDYAGAVVLVSHDRALLGASCDQYLLVGHGEVKRFDGDLDDYANWLQRAGNQNSGKSSAPAPAAKMVVKIELDPAAKRERKKELQSQLKKLDTAISKLGESKLKLDGDLAKTAQRVDAKVAAELTELGKQQVKLERDLGQAEQTWLEVAQELEALA